MPPEAVLDSSTLISLARAGLLHLLPNLPVAPVLLDVVHEEVVSMGRRLLYADATSIEVPLKDMEVTASNSEYASADAAVLAGAQQVGMLICSDLTLGRRARNLGVSWMRTADLVIAALQLGKIDANVACGAIAALRDSGRITEDLASSYLEEIL